jgi:hypothetical protein
MSTKGNVSGMYDEFVKRVSGEDDSGGAYDEFVEQASKSGLDVPSWERASVDPCTALAQAGKQTFEAGLPIPDAAASGYSNEQYDCFINGYYKAQNEAQAADVKSKDMLIFGGLAVVGLFAGLWYASKKRWI